MTKKNIINNIILIIIVGLIMAISYTYFIRKHRTYESITSFKECISAGYPVLQTYPEICSMPGKSFTNPLQKKTESTSSTLSDDTGRAMFKNLSYYVDGQELPLRNGTGTLIPAIISDEAPTFVIVGDQFLQDINNDSIADTIFLLRSDDTRTNTSRYYISAAMSLRNGFTGLNVLSLGKNLVGGMFTYNNGEIVFGFATAHASSTVSQKYFVLEDLLLKEVIRQ